MKRPKSLETFPCRGEIQPLPFEPRGDFCSTAWSRCKSRMIIGLQDHLPRPAPADIRHQHVIAQVRRICIGAVRAPRRTRHQRVDIDAFFCAF
ncbi:hypothetical protein WJ33_01580 [Burkholderia ubonensis]|uniref:Uncharacterized protein n=1 Tax=Burkholderia ubonensis TaxID=101571 RepID=A0A103QNB9_9BURK|nr:hypothetical protein WJ33_01580 [Burkholderia ubonensis]